MTMQLSDQQRAAVETEHAAYTVRAAAGSGKTRVLVARFLRLVLHHGFSADSILTITFTRKAASEMKRRVIRELRQAGAHEQARLAETGPIQTVHSFCERMLRDHSVLVGVDPQFEIREEGSSGSLEEEVVRSELMQMGDDHPLMQQWVANNAGKAVWGRPRSLDQSIQDSVGSVLSVLRASGLTPQEVRAKMATPQKYEDSFVEAIAASLSPDAAGVFLRTEGRLSEKCQAVVAAKLPRPQWMNAVRPNSGAPEFNEETVGLVELAMRVWERTEAIMEMEQSFDFAYLERRAVRAIVECPALRARLGRQYRAVLVDESQDLNPVQYRLVDGLGIERIMMVGDPQQSIYGFRQADYHLFVDRTLSTPTLPLSVNHRVETPGILNFIDRFFEATWGANYEPMAPKVESDDPFGGEAGSFEGVELWNSGQAHTHQIAQQIVRLINEGEAPGEITVLTRQVAQLRDLAEALDTYGIRRRIEADTERLYTRMVARDIACAIEAAANPAERMALLPLLHSPFVGLSLDSIVVLAREPSVWASLPTFQPPIPEDRPKIEAFLAWFARLTPIADRLAAWEVLSHMFADSPYFTEIAKGPEATQDLANARRFLELAASRPELGVRAFAEYLRSVQRLQHRTAEPPSIDSDRDEVTLMTIHKSKGLEFPVCVVPYLHQVPRNHQSVLCDWRSGLIAETSGKLENVPFQFLRSSIEERDRAEADRLLYVAMTRACRRLCVAASPKAKPGSLARRIAQAVGFTGEDLFGARAVSLEPAGKLETSW